MPPLLVEERQDSVLLNIKGMLYWDMLLLDTDGPCGSLWPFSFRTLCCLASLNRVSFRPGLDSAAMEGTADYITLSLLICAERPT